MSSNNEEKQKFKILALDGGGIRGVVTACILQEVRDQVGKPLNQHFDLIAGTSTGSILAAGLAIGMKPKDLIKVYQERGREIFHSSWFQKKGSWFQGPKYSHKGLIKVLQEKLGEITLRQVDEIPSTETELLILAYDMLHRNTTFFTSKCPESNRWFNDMKLWEICVASSSAPTFFPPYEFRWTDPNDSEKKEWGLPHIDGGVSANCPALAALSHVMKVRKKSLEDISILSIGTGRTTHPIKYKMVKNLGKIGWGSKVTDIFMGGQIQLATDTCQEVITSIYPKGYLRLQFDINQAFGERKNPLSPRPLLDKKERKNQFIGKRISEAMDDSSQKTIEELIEAATKFTKSNSETIQEFIKNQQPVST
ncbi:MAG: patatin-like phospholipase family protein [Spirulinaceae cyanobacterium]